MFLSLINSGFGFMDSTKNKSSTGFVGMEATCTHQSHARRPRFQPESSQRLQEQSDIVSFYRRTDQASLLAIQASSHGPCDFSLWHPGTEEKTQVSGHSAPVISSRMSALFTPSLNPWASPWLGRDALTIPWDSVHLHHFLVALAEVAG